MKISLGQVARGDGFFNRKQLIKNAWRLIESGNNILISAPRRVGKTSLMNYLKDNPKDGYDFFLINMESVNSINEFYKRLMFKLLESDLSSPFRAMVNKALEHLPTIRKLNSDLSLEFGDSIERDYFTIFKELLLKFDFSGNKLIIMIDEFPQTLVNIVENEDEAEGKRFLHTNRELRIAPEINDNVQFIYAGSIGLENVVASLDVISTINDLSLCHVKPLVESEAKDLIAQLNENYEFSMNEDITKSFLDKVKWLIPFYIQIYLSAVNIVCEEIEENEVTEDILEKAVFEILLQRNHFEHWHTRLRSSQITNDYNFSKDILNYISIKNEIKNETLFDLAEKNDRKDELKNILKMLEFDGYINRSKETDAYTFNSPFLQMWWKENVAI